MYILVESFVKVTNIYGSIRFLQGLYALFAYTNSDLPNTSIIYTLLVGMTYIYDFCWHGIYPYRHARAILMCLTLLNSFNHMKSFTMFIFSWLKFVKKRGTSIYLLRVYVMPSTLCIHCTFLLWHCLKFWRIDWNRTADDSTLRKPLLSLGG